MVDKQSLDVRGLACPEPVELVLEAVSKLGDGQYLEVIHYQEPKLLYPLLQKRGFDFVTITEEESLITVLIWRIKDSEAKNGVDAAILAKD